MKIEISGQVTDGQKRLAFLQLLWETKMYIEYGVVVKIYSMFRNNLSYKCFVVSK